MAVGPANASEPAGVASEVGAVVFEGDLRYPSETGGWPLGNLDFTEYLDRYPDQQVTGCPSAKSWQNEISVTLLEGCF